MRSPAAYLLAFTLTIATLAPARVACAALTTTIPPRLIRAAVGCWQIRDGYRVHFTASGSGLSARQQFSLRGAPVISVVEYLAADDVFGIPRIDSHHGGSLVFRMRAGHMEVSFYSRYFRDATPWRPISHCP